MSRKALCWTAALLFLLAACGRDPDPESERVVSSPLVSPSSTPEETDGATASARPRSTAAVTGRTAAPGGTQVPTGDLSAARIKVTRIATMSEPMSMAIRPDDSTFYIAEKGGRVRPLLGSNPGNPIINISGEVSTGNEQGLLGLAFSPNGRKMYINFTRGDGDTVVREYDFAGGRASSPRTVLEVDQPYANHNGGNLMFGPDGYLYIGLGDGGSGGDPHNNGQNLDTLLGKMLRIDPDPSGSAAYSSPSSNPYVGRDGRDEIWAYGLRNPWRYTFDKANGDLWIADVGQNQWEEINHDSSGAGDNYGWRRMEGTHAYGGNTAPSNHHRPIYEYSHDGGNCSVTGGYVYRGSKIGNLRGAYVFADYCVGRLRAFVENGGRAQNHRFLGPQVSELASFGQAANGELYILSRGGGIYRIDPA